MATSRERCATARTRTRRRTGRSSRNRWAGPWQVHQGKELSYTNLLDLDAAARIALEFTEPAARRHQAHQSVRRGDGRRRRPTPTSARARPIRCRRSAASSASTGRSTSRRRTALTVDVHRSRDRAGGRRTTRGRSWRRRRTCAWSPPTSTALAEPMAFGDFERRARSSAACSIRQRDRVDRSARAVARRRSARRSSRSVRRRRRSGRRCASRGASARTSSRTRSSSPRADRTLAVGAGQMSRVDAVKVAVMKAGDGCAARVGGGLRRVLPVPRRPRRAGRRRRHRVVQPGGSVRDAEVIAAADEHGLAMVFTGRRHFRH